MDETNVLPSLGTYARGKMKLTIIPWYFCCNKQLNIKGSKRSIEQEEATEDCENAENYYSNEL